MNESETISNEEVTSVLIKMKFGRLVGLEGITGELLMKGGEAVVE